MGSLMAGWDSPVQDPKQVSLERNKSFTNEEIESFWRLHKEYKKQKQEKQGCGAFGSLNSKSEGAEAESSLNSGWFKFAGNEYPVDLEKAINIGDWWTRSNWAFLNEASTEENNESSHKYASQFHVAQLGTNKCTPAH